MWIKKKGKKKEGKHSVRVPSNSSRNSFQCVNDRLWIFSSSFVLVVVLINTVKSGRWCCSVRLTLCQGGDTNHKQKLRSRKRVSHRRLVTWPNRKKGQKTCHYWQKQGCFFTEKSTDAASCETKAEQQISQQTTKPLAVIVLSWEGTVPGNPISLDQWQTPGSIIWYRVLDTGTCSTFVLLGSTADKSLSPIH